MSTTSPEPPDDLTVFLLARMEEKEAAAESLHPAYANATTGAVMAAPLNVVARRDHVKAEVAAARAVAALYETSEYCERDGLVNAMLALVGPYADHPDYDPLWTRLLLDAVEARDE